MELVDVLGGLLGGALGWVCGSFKAWLHGFRGGSLKDAGRGQLRDRPGDRAGDPHGARSVGDPAASGDRSARGARPAMRLNRIHAR